MPSSAVPQPVLTTRQLNKRIIPIVCFTFICYLSIGLPLAIIPGFTHNQLGFNTVIAGFAISIQYIATLLSRPHAGRYADLLGPKKVVLMGLSCCSLSGLMYLFAALTAATPWTSLGLLFIGRLVLGIGESFASTGSTLWGIARVGQFHTARVISWNGVATYGAIAIGAPLGVWLNSLGGIGAVGLFVFFVGLGAWAVALGKPAVSIVTGKRIAFTTVVGKIWPYGLGLGLGTIGFGVIISFITLYFADLGWSGAAFSLTLMSCAFVGVRLISGNAINLYGGLNISLLSFICETLGLLLIWVAPSALVADLGALLTGAGFSLVFPALGVEAVKQVPPQNQGTALGTYSAFLDLGLSLAGPAAGFIMSHLGMSYLYLCAAMMAALAALLMVRLKLRVASSTRQHG
ncbi:MFS transporter [Sodalis sp. dw_96]|uniref:MFS transporter n=1 Tax=Sodalis sp. dw_96 TaxID=2719794 RepID=UPI001BD2A462|nr:MFS transporter [Sodalis sp. dw_96]